MKWIRGSQGGKTFYGILEDDRVTPVQGDPFSGYEKLLSLIHI